MNIDIKKELFFGWGSGGCGSFDGWCPALSHGKGTEFTFRLSSPPYSASPSTSPTACQLSYFPWPGGSGAGATSIYTKTLTDIASELATLKSIFVWKMFASSSNRNQASLYSWVRATRISVLIMKSARWIKCQLVKRNKIETWSDQSTVL